MKNLIFLVKDACSGAIQKAFSSQISPVDAIAEVALCVQKWGHYQCNSSLKLAKILKIKPREVAETIVSHLSLKPLFAKVDIAGPGFINLTIDPLYLSKELTQAIRDDTHLGVDIPAHRQRIVVDFSCPNIAKELHVGHLRSTIIGDTIARLLEFFGHDVLRLNHVGDWGAQFGMLIAYLKKFHPGILKKSEVSDLSLLTKWYKEAKKKYDDDDAFKKEAQKEVVALQRGNKDSLESWKILCEISRRAFQEIYDFLDVRLIERGESFYNPFLQDLIDDLEKKGLIQLSVGAKCIYLDGFKNREGEPLPLMVQKSDGGFNYDTTDLAAMRHRIQVEKADRIIIVTDAGQSLHFQLIYGVAVLAGYLDPKKVQFDHVPFGSVLGPDGKKFKTRSGETEKLIDLLLEAVSHAKSVLQERLPDLSANELNELARIIGIDAVKYADLSCHRIKDYLFSYDRMLKLEGNTAIFLLYSYVRILGIKRKTNANIEKLIKEQEIVLVHPSEIALGLHLRRFGEILEMVSKDLLPNHLAEYLYELAEKFNAFFRDCRVEGSFQEKERLVLCELASRILEKGMEILGLKTVSRL